MGYYTYYTMDAQHIKDENQYNSIVKRMKEMELLATEDKYGVFDESKYFIVSHNAHFASYDETKWYEYTSDMCKLSKEFSEVVFKLHGEGEERDDMWNEYYQNGEYEECVAHITYDEPAFIKWEE